MGTIDIDSIVQIESQVLIWTLVGIIVILLLAFVRGLFRGWRYGTYRLGYFLILMVIGLACLSPISNAVGGINIAQWYAGPISLSLDNQTYSIEVSTLYGTIYNAVDVLAKSSGLDKTPAQMTAFVGAFSQSIIKFLVIFIEGILLATVFNLLGLLLWHIAFKHIIPKQHRKETYKKGKIWSSIEEFVGVTLVMAMLVLPITSVLNSVVTGWQSSDASLSDEEKASLKATDSTYNTISTVVDTYSNSALANVFFNWTKSNGSSSFDTSLMNFFTKCDYGELSVSITEELGTIANLGSTFVKTGVLSSEGSDATKAMLILDSKFTPMLVGELSKSKLMTSVLPFAVNVITHMDSVKSQLGLGLDTDYYSYDWAKSLDNLSGIIDDLQESGAMGGFGTDENGQLKYDYEKVSDIWEDTASEKMADFFARTKDGNSDWALFSDLIKTFSAKTALNAEKSDTALTVADFLPDATGVQYTTDANGVKIPSGSIDDLPDSFKNLDLGNEVGVLYRSMGRLYKVDSDFIGLAINGAISGEFNTKELTGLIVDNIDDVAGAITGEDEDGAIETDDDGTSKNDDCLLDSSLVNNAMPKLVKVMSNTVTSSLGGDVDLSVVDDTLFGEGADSNNDDTVSSGETMLAVKNEFHSVLGVIKDFTGNEEAKNFLKNIDTLPGITFDPDGTTLNYISDDLITAVANSLGSLDESKILSAILPAIFESYLGGEDGPLSSLGLGDISLSFSIDGLGAALKSLLLTYRDCQGLINFMRTSGFTSGTVSTGTLKGLTPYLENETKDDAEVANSSQLYKLLTGFAGSKILNPDTKEEGSETIIKNSNFRSLIVMVMKTVTGNDDFSYTGDLDVEEDSAAITDLLKAALSGSAVSFLSGAMSGSIDMATLSDVDFEALLEPVGRSELLATCFGALLDKQVLGLFEGDTTGVSFTNLKLDDGTTSDWKNEGASLNALVKAASEIGDLSNIDFFNSDSTAVGNIIKCLSSSKIFGEGTDYKFGSFFYGVLKSSLGEDNMSYLNDADGTDTKIKARFTTMDASAWFNEAETFSDIIYYLQKIGGIDTFSGSSINWSKITSERLGGLLDTLSESQSIGQNVTYKLYSTIISTLTSSGLSLGTDDDKLGNCNVNYIYDLFDDTSDDGASARQKELSKITDLVAAVTNPSYGLVGADGSLPSSIDMTSMSGEFFIKPVLSALASSYVFNTVNKESIPTAFECEIADVASKAGIYGTDVSYDTILGYVEDVDDSRYLSSDTKAAVATRLEFSSPTCKWKIEVDNISSVVDGVVGLGIDFNNFQAQDLFKNKDKTANLEGAALEARRQELEDVLSSVNASTVFFRALPNFIKTGLDSIGSSLGDISMDNANVYYMGKGDSAEKYGEDEIKTLTYLMELGLTSEFSTTDFSSLDPEKTGSLLSYMSSSHILNSKAGDTGSTVYQSVISKFLSDGTLGSYYYSATSPKDVAQADKYANASAKGIYYAETLFPDIAKTADAEDYRTAHSTSLLGTDNGSIQSILQYLKDNSGLLDDFQNNNLKNIDSAVLSGLLKEVNKSPLFMDAVPNAINKFFSTSGNTSSLSDISFSNANPYYEYYLTSTADYTAQYLDEEIDNLANIIKNVADISGFSTSDLSSLNATSTSDLLTELASSRIFNSLPNGTLATKATVFQGALASILSDGQLGTYYFSSDSPKDSATGLYNLTNYLHYSATGQTDAYTKALYYAKNLFPDFSTSLAVSKILDYVDQYCDPINGTTYSIYTMLTFVTADENSGLLTSFQGGSLKSIDNAKLESLLKELNGNIIFHDIVPNAINSFFTGPGTGISGFSLTNANTFYAYDYDATNKAYYASGKPNYDNSISDEEITNLAKIIGDIGTSMDTSDLDNLDADKTSDLLARLSSSPIFNSIKKTGSATDVTVFQGALASILSGDQLGSYYYYADSPKDVAQADKYTNASSKGTYYAKTYFPDFIGAKKSLADYQAAYCDSLTSSGDGYYSIKTLLSFFKKNAGILSSFSSNSLKSINGTTLQSLLLELNGNELFQDTVPNSLAKFFSGTELSIEGLYFDKANAFFAYYTNGFGDYVNYLTSGVTTDYDNQYPVSEIEAISSLIKEISDSSNVFNSLTSSFSDAGITTVKTLLTDLSESYIFHKAGAYEPGTASVSTPWADLTVFEQGLFKIYNVSQLAKRSFSDIYDSVAYESVIDSDDAYLLKLHDKVKKVTSLEIEKTEIDNLTENDTKTSGLLHVIVSEGFASSGLNLDSTSLNFSSITPAKMSSIMKEINKLYCISDLVPYEVKNLVGTTMGLSGYSSITSAVTVSGVTSYESPEVSAGHLLTLNISGSDSFTLNYSYDGANYETKDYLLTCGGDRSISQLPLYYRITGLDSATTYTITSTYDTSNFFLGDKEASGIDALSTFASSMFSGGSYKSVSGADASSLGSMLSSIVTFLDTPDSFYLSRGYDSSFKGVSASASFYSRDITLRNALKFTDSGHTIDLGKYLGYDGSAITMTEAGNLTSLSNIFTSYASSGTSAKEVGDIEGEWMTTGLATGAAMQYAIEQIPGGSAGGYTLPDILTRMESVSTKTSGVYPLISLMSSPSVTVDSESYVSYFGKGIANGLVANLLAQQVAFGKDSTSGNHNLAGTAALPSDFSARSSAVTAASGTDAKYGFTSLDFTNDSSITALTNILDVHSLVSPIKMLSGGTYDGTSVAALFNARSSATGDILRLYQFFYSGTEYDGLLNNAKFTLDTLLTDHTDYQNAFGISGNYLVNVADQAFSFSAVAAVC